MQPDAHLLIRKGRVLDPASERDEVADVLVENGRLSRIGASLDAPGAEIMDAEGLWVMPGLVDACIRLSEPGGGCTGSIASETRAAAAGGITHLGGLPDTEPVVDNAAVVRLIREQAQHAGFARVLPLGALTHQLKGDHLVEMHSLYEAGCAGFSNAGAPVSDSLVLKRCLEYAANFNLPVFLQPRDAALSAHGCAHDGRVATHLGLPGVPVDAETVALARDLLLVEATGVRAHFHQISAAASLRLLREARGRGLPVTADVSIHHLLLDENALAGFNSLCHIQPPLRHSNDRQALLEAVADGTVDAICSQHTPLNSSARHAPFPQTPPGMAGLDTLLPLVLHLTETQRLPLQRALDAVTHGPARCLDRPAGRLEPGHAASLCVVDPNQRGTPAEDWLSAGRNSPWLNTELPGRVRLTVCEGKISWLSD